MFSEDALQFSWQAQHFGRVHRHFSWQAQHFRRVVLRVFCESHWQGCVKWRHGADSVVGVAFCEMYWKPRTKHRFWDSKFSGSRENSWENVDFDATKCQNWRKSRAKRLFWCSHVSRLESLVCLWRRRVYGKLQDLSFSHVSTCENWRKSRTKCSFCCSHVSRLESLVFLWPRRVYGVSCKTCTFQRFPSRLSCRFAWQAWHFVTFQPVW